MEGLQRAIRSVLSKEPSITTATNLPSSSFDTGFGSSSASPSDTTSLLLTRPPSPTIISHMLYNLWDLLEPFFAYAFVLTGNCIGVCEHGYDSVHLCPSCRRSVSLLTCSKLCAFCFVAGIIVGYTLKQRVRRLAARLLRRIKDD